MSKVFSHISSGVSYIGLASDPSDPQNGDFYYNTTSNVFRQYINGAWQNVGTSNTTGTVTSVAASVPSFLSISGSPITTSGTLAISYSGTALPIANGGTAATTAANAFINLSPLATAGDIIYENSTPAPAALGIGSTGQVLTVVGGLPAWATPTSGANTALSNLANPTAINQALTFATAGGFILGENGASTVAGGNITIESGAGNGGTQGDSSTSPNSWILLNSSSGSGAPGSLTVSAGAGASAVAGASATLQGGQGDAQSGTGATHVANGGTSAGAGGSATTNGGAGISGQIGGSASINGGSGDAVGGGASVTANGGTTTGGGGTVVVLGGNGGSGLAGANATIQAGAGNGGTQGTTQGTSPNAFLSLGASNASGTGGLSVLAGGSGASGLAGGSLLLIGGGGDGNGSGSAAELSLGPGNAAGAGGATLLTGGTGSSGNAGGAINIEAGGGNGSARGNAATSTNAWITVNASNASSAPGTLVLSAGNGGTGVAGANTTITGGNGNSTSSTGGGIVLSGGSSAGVLGSATITGTLNTGGSVADTSVQYVTSAGNFTINNNVWHVVVNAGTQTTLTVTMPSSPPNGQLITVAFVGAVTTLSVVANSGQTLDGTPTAAAVNAFASWVYVASVTTWFRCG